MKQSSFVVAALLAAFTPTLANARGPAGPARAVDGDTLEVGGEEVRLYGIDAPELHQTCRRGDEEWSCGAIAARQLARAAAENARAQGQVSVMDSLEPFLPAARNREAAPGETDEPLSGMDPLARRKTIRLIREWARAGKSVVVSSHILH